MHTISLASSVNPFLVALLSIVLPVVQSNDFLNQQHLKLNCLSRLQHLPDHLQPHLQPGYSVLQMPHLTLFHAYFAPLVSSIVEFTARVQVGCGPCILQKTKAAVGCGLYALPVHHKVSHQLQHLSVTSPGQADDVQLARPVAFLEGLLEQREVELNVVAGVHLPPHPPSRHGPRAESAHQRTKDSTRPQSIDSYDSDLPQPSGTPHRPPIHQRASLSEGPSVSFIVMPRLVIALSNILNRQSHDSHRHSSTRSSLISSQRLPSPPSTRIRSRFTSFSILTALSFLIFHSSLECSFMLKAYLPQLRSSISCVSRAVTEFRSRLGAGRWVTDSRSKVEAYELSTSMWQLVVTESQSASVWTDIYTTSIYFRLDPIRAITQSSKSCLSWHSFTSRLFSSSKQAQCHSKRSFSSRIAPFTS